MHNGIMSIRSRIAGIVIKDDRILLMRRKKNGNNFYVFPGGGMEDGERQEDTVEREFMEETTVEVKAKKLLYEVHLDSNEYGSKDQYYFDCDYITGEPVLGDCEEKDSILNDNQEYEPMWVPILDLKDYLLYPLEIRDLVIEDITTNFKYTPRKISLRFENLRQ